LIQIVRPQKSVWQGGECKPIREDFALAALLVTTSASSEATGLNIQRRYGIMAKIDGTGGSDTLNGGTGSDTIVGYHGNDVIAGANLTTENLLIDGSFESAKIGAGKWTHFAEVGGWRSDTGVEVWGKDFIVKSDDGNVAVELDFDNRFSKIWQDVKTAAGQEYVLSLDTALRPGTAAATNAINVFWNGQQVAHIEPGSTQWAKNAFKVVGSGGTDRLEFREDANKSDSLGGLIDNVKLQAQGNGNALLGGVGNDVITAGNTNDLLVGNDGKTGNADMTKLKIVDDVTAHVTFDGSGAGYRNAIGVYTYDASGTITGTKLIYADVSGAGAQGLANVDFGLKAGENFGFFLAANAQGQAGNAALLNNAATTYKLVDATSGGTANVNAGHEFKLVAVAADGTTTDIKTANGTSIFTTHTSANGDGYRHAQTVVDPVNGKLSVKFEDLWNGGDQNFFDGNFTVNIGVTNAVQLAHEGVFGTTSAYNNDMLSGGIGNDTIMGLSGNDTLNGGTGTNKLFGGSGNDKFVASGGNDQIVGGSGRDMLDVSNATGGVRVDLSKSTMSGFGTSSVKSIEDFYGSSFDDVVKGSKAANDLTGGAGNDSLRGFSGADTLTGGAGDDTFRWQRLDVMSKAGTSLGMDHITDFDAGNDTLDLRKIFSGIKGDHAKLVDFVDTKAGTEIYATLGDHKVGVAVLDGVHGLTVADLVASQDLLI
jgi:Ca2+-binding RTX toxin-like protein